MMDQQNQTGSQIDQDEEEMDLGPVPPELEDRFLQLEARKELARETSEKFASLFEARSSLPRSEGELKTRIKLNKDLARSFLDMIGTISGEPEIDQKAIKQINEIKPKIEVFVESSEAVTKSSAELGILEALNRHPEIWDFSPAIGEAGKVLAEITGQQWNRLFSIFIKQLDGDRTACLLNHLIDTQVGIQDLRFRYHDGHLYATFQEEQSTRANA